MERDAFRVLGLEPRFDLSREDIERRYLALVAAHHPDAAPGAGADDSGSARLNDARAALLDPERRAGALLAALGGPPPDQDKSLPPEFLAEMLEVREQVDEALASGDPARVHEWHSRARDRRARMIEDVGAAFAALTAPPAPAALAGIRRGLNAWRYIERMIEQIEHALR